MGNLTLKGRESLSTYWIQSVGNLKPHVCTLYYIIHYIYHMYIYIYYIILYYTLYIYHMYIYIYYSICIYSFHIQKFGRNLVDHRVGLKKICPGHARSGKVVVP